MNLYWHGVQIGVATDRWCNAVFLGGDYDTTVSTHTALARQAGKRWGCIGCRILAAIVEPGHCDKALSPYTQEKRGVMIRIGLEFLAAWIAAEWSLYLLALAIT